MRKLIPLFFIVLLGSPGARAEMLSELSATDKAKLESGGSVVLTVEKEGAVWP